MAILDQNFVPPALTGEQLTIINEIARRNPPGWVTPQGENFFQLISADTLNAANVAGETLDSYDSWFAPNDEDYNVLTSAIRDYARSVAVYGQQGAFRIAYLNELAAASGETPEIAGEFAAAQKFVAFMQAQAENLASYLERHKNHSATWARIAYYGRQAVEFLNTVVKKSIDLLTKTAAAIVQIPLRAVPGWVWAAGVVLGGLYLATRNRKTS